MSIDVGLAAMLQPRPQTQSAVNASPFFKRGTEGDSKISYKPTSDILYPFRLTTSIIEDMRLTERARHLRRNMTDAERRLWQYLRRDQIYGVRFYRQRPMAGRFIVDFYAPRARLVVEVDGSQHFDPSEQARDSSRTVFLERLGLHVLRYDNHQVLVETVAVVEDIGRWVNEILHDRPLDQSGAKPAVRNTS